MPFQVSIIDSAGSYAASGQAQVATVVDHSNYDTAAESGHAQANFSDYKKITLTSLYGTYSYILASIAGGDVLINAPSAEATLPITSTIPYDVDDVWNVVVIAVPTWDAAVAYVATSDHHVYYNGSIYQCIQNGTNKNPATETAYWTEVEDDDLPIKYRLSHNFKIDYDILDAYTEQVRLANDNTKDLYRADLSGDPNFQAASKLWTMKEAMVVDANLGQWARVNDTIVKAKELINGI